ncbi:hypothetical protein [Pseudoruegeria sp. HB172150]|uniref:hypothetical protein n=1 Tax=Pseudoruegeria sp. HB172150 TaxID=2721164 RepID=UPI00155494F3|nr:hypothetical protein [Pseudoruegeria sp. HB172150]
MSPQKAIALEAWGDEPPDWILALADACAASSQNKVAKRLGMSATVISQTLRRKYPGDLSNLEQLVQARLMGAVVDCPALGELPLADCQAWREKAKDFLGTNSLRVRMYRACTRCPLNPKEDEK